MMQNLEIRIRDRPTRSQFCFRDLLLDSINPCWPQQFFSALGALILAAYTACLTKPRLFPEPPLAKPLYGFSYSPTKPEPAKCLKNFAEFRIKSVKA